MELFTFHLFSGAGGGILADLLLGHRPIGAVEIDAYCRQVLLCRQADGYIPQFPIWDNVLTFRSDNPDTAGYINRLREIRERLCVSGGFPCQGCSAAGKGNGLKDPRSGLWREFGRIVGEIRPKYVFLENSNLLIRRGLDVVLTDLTEMGYRTAWGVISAASVGARHVRRRFWGLAVRDDANSQSERRETDCNTCEPKPKLIRPAQLLQLIPDTMCKWSEDRLAGSAKSQKPKTLDGRRKDQIAQGQRRQAQPRLGRVADGLANWLDEVTSGRFWDAQEHGLPRLTEQCDNRRQRLKAIGNGQVPLCAAAAFETLKDILESYDC